MERTVLLKDLKF